jgi:hypothetical protein
MVGIAQTGSGKTLAVSHLSLNIIIIDTMNFVGILTMLACFFAVYVACNSSY